MTFEKLTIEDQTVNADNYNDAREFAIREDRENELKKLACLDAWKISQESAN
jgi:hypothetical protein|tara:strand:- start:150 stop:305 length:156 start_codon:yes stop_codon:yes gene_type:complete